MAGSLNHIVSETGKFTMATIENMGDAHEALHECFELIRILSLGQKENVNAICKRKHFPKIKVDMVESGWDI